MTGWLDDIIGAEIRDDGTALTTPQRRILNFIGGATIADNPTTRAIDIDLTTIALAFPLLVPVSTAPTTPAAGKSYVWSDADGLHVKDQYGVVTDL